MPRSSKSVKRHKPKFRQNLSNRKLNATRKEKRKKECKSEESAVKNAWDVRKTVTENLSDMGLAANPNRVLPIIQPNRAIYDAVPIDGVVPFDGKVEKKEYARRYKKKSLPQAKEVIPTLEAKVREEEANIELLDRAQPLPHRDIQLCIYYLARYGSDDYKAMSRDPKNLFQLTPKQIEKRIKLYKESPLYKVMETL
ncbi:unnamed protein product [Auanema sp. JU1783]|nr:unnamed protein product [Auanema sp. JU1783]